MVSRPSPLAALPGPLTHLGFAVSAGLLLVAVGQPLFTDDLWWHLALGTAYAQEGLRLAADPLLFTAPGPPAPAAWLSDLALSGVERGGGFTALRGLHVLWVAAILLLSWQLIRRASGSSAAASLGSSVFVTLAAYRLVQLRPHLFTMLAALVLYRLLLECRNPPSAIRVALAAALLAVWSNAHGGFPLGLVLPAAALAGLVTAAPLRSATQRQHDRGRGLRLAGVLVVLGVATLANPDGAGAHLAWFAAGDTTPSLLRVGDEWLPVSPFRLPVAGLPPSPLAWGLFVALLVASVSATAWAARGWRGRADAAGGVDPALMALAGIGLAASLVAVRFLWLGIFALLLLAQAFRAWHSRAEPRSAWSAWSAWAPPVATCLVVLGFVQAGAWPMISRGLQPSLESYAQPYAAGKYPGHAVWMLRDSGVDGNLFNDYPLGGFLGFWLAPGVRTFLNGSLNVRPDTLDAGRALRERRGMKPGETFLELLDRLEIDLFLGTRLPETGPTHRPWDYTTAHLEGAPGWLPIFRNLNSAVYLRADERNARNLERVAAWYDAIGVRFDRDSGFDVEYAFRKETDWARTQAIAPVGIRSLVAATGQPQAGPRNAALDRLVSIEAALGLYERAVSHDRRLLRAEPEAVRSRRRLAWSLLRLGRFAEALEAAGPLAEQPVADLVSHEILATARDAGAAPDDPALAARIARLPVFTRAEAAALSAGFLPASTRARLD